MSPCRKVTFVRPAAPTRSFACARESGEMSTEMKLAPGLFLASVTVWAPTPQPASSTRLPAG